MDAILISAGLAALAEVGDKTQILALVLAARFGKPWTIAAAVLAAMLVNHGLAMVLGEYLVNHIEESALRWIAVAALLGLAGWTLAPGKLRRPPGDRTAAGIAFAAAFVAILLVEMGDKSQVATVALVARFESIPLVAVGSTLGVMLAAAPAVLIGEAAAERLPGRWLRFAAAAGFAAIAVWVLAFG
jgi:putative Ca2+/H+ antiporter (TMEM165/GDT1 family)